MKVVGVLLVFLVLSLPFAQADSIKKDGDLYEITEHVRISRGNGSIPLNLSDPEQVKKYSPVNCFWNTNLTGGGIITDGILPPDILRINSTSVSIVWNFTLSSDMIADGASEFYLRLPVSFYIRHFSESSPQIKILITTISQGVLFYNNSVGVKSEDITNQTISYANRTFNLWYVHLFGFLFPSMRYTIALNITNIYNATMLIYDYDFLNDNSTEFVLNSKKYGADAAFGFEFKTLTSNGISALKANSEGPNVWPQANYTISIPLDNIYVGNMYVSFAIEIYVNGSDIHSTDDTLTISFWTSKDINSTHYTLHAGMQTVRGYMRLNFDGDNSVVLSLTSPYPFYIITEGYSKNPAVGTFTPNLDFNLETYMKPYADIVVNPEEYYTPGAIVLPGSIEKSFALAIKYAPFAALPVVLQEVELLSSAYTVLKVFQWASNLVGQAVDFVAGKIMDLLRIPSSLFKWFYDAIVHFFTSAAAWAGFALIKAIWFILYLVILVLAIWIIDSFLRGIVALPQKGFKGMLAEWQGVTSFVESMAGFAGRLIRRVPK